MQPRHLRLKERNQRIREQFNELSEKHPEWRSDALIEELSKRFYLSTRTIEAVLRGEGCYS